MEDKILTLKEAADFLRVEEVTINGLLWRKEIPYVKVGKERKIRFSDIQKYIKSLPDQIKLRENKPKKKKVKKNACA